MYKQDEDVFAFVFFFIGWMFEWKSGFLKTWNVLVEFSPIKILIKTLCFSYEAEFICIHFLLWEWTTFCNEWSGRVNGKLPRTLILTLIPRYFGFFLRKIKFLKINYCERRDASRVESFFTQSYENFLQRDI